MYFLESRGPNNTKILPQPIVLFGCREKRQSGWHLSSQCSKTIWTDEQGPHFNRTKGLLVTYATNGIGMNENGYQQGRLFEHLPTNMENEEFLPLFSSGTTRIERIVSSGQSSPADFWYDQDEDEFVLLVSGSAIMSIEGHDKKVELKSGDWIKLPAHRRHRVEWTSADPVTVWLAVFTKP